MSLALAAHRLSPEAFAPYGVVLEAPSHASPSLERGDITFWHATGDLAALQSTGVTGYLVAHQRAAQLQQLERHQHTCEAFVPLQGRSLMVVAPPGELDLQRISVFVLEPGHGVLLHQGTWHWAPFPLAETADFLLVLRRQTPDEDIEIADIPLVQLRLPTPA